jgi:catechol 2,3-dioxygenase-like lactoylglutathione lyase family enzyme
MGAIDETLRKFHISLTVASLDRSTASYRTLLGVAPAKLRMDYAKFELAEPALVLSLVPGSPGAAGVLNHVGLRVRSSEELNAIQHRLEAAGMTTRREEGVECCYATQTKFWIADPDRTLWEIYVFLEDVDDAGPEAPAAVLPAAVSPAAVSPAAPPPAGRGHGRIASASRFPRASPTTTTRCTRRAARGRSTCRRILPTVTACSRRSCGRFGRAAPSTSMV